MGFVEIIGLVSTVAQVIIKAIPFVEELFNGKADSGAEKAACVMNMAQVAISGVDGLVAKENQYWKIIEPLAKNFIDAAIKAVNEIEAAQKGA